MCLSEEILPNSSTLECLPHQIEFIEAEDRFLLNSGGVGSGKTYGLCLRALRLLFNYPGIVGLLGAATMPQLRETTMEVFLELCPPEAILDYNKSRSRIVLVNKSVQLFRPLEFPKRLKSYTLGFSGIEEMTDAPEEAFKMLRTRNRQPGMPGCIFGATNPGTFGNWVYKYFIEQPLAGSRVVYSATTNNSYLPPEFLADMESLKNTNPDYYRRMVEGIWGAMEGLIYNLPMRQRIKTPHKTKTDGQPDPAYLEYVKGFDSIIAGLDFGFTHPTGMSIAGRTGKKWTLFDEVYKRNLSAAQVVDLVADLHSFYRFSVVYCDNARPEIISDLVKRGVPARPCIKGEDSVFLGIMHVISMIGSGEMEVSQNGCPFTLREIDSYVWDERNVKREQPIKANDHILDAIRYMCHSEAKAKKFEFVSIGPDGLR